MWKVRISGCRVEGLYDTGSWRDKQDPAVEFLLGNAKIGTTKRAKDGGVAAEFDDVFEMSLSEEDFNAKELTVRAINVGMMGGETFISEGKQRIFNTVPRLNKTVSTNITLLRESKPAGIAFIDIMVSASPKTDVKSEAEAKSEVPGVNVPSEEEKHTSPSITSSESNRKSSSAPWKLVIEELSIKDLHTTGNPRDKQDPCIKLWLNDLLLGKTARLKDAGISGTFPEQFKASISEEIFMTGILKIETYNESLFGNLTPVGSGSVKIRDVVADEDVNDEAEVCMELTFEGKQEGRVKFLLYIDAPNRPVPSPEEIQAKVERRKDEAAAKIISLQEKRFGKSEEPPALGAQNASAANDDISLPVTVPLHGGDKSTGPGATLRMAKQHSTRRVGKKASIPFGRGKLNMKGLTCSDMGDKNSKVFFSIELNNSSQSHETQPSYKKDGIWHEDFLGISMDVERHHIHGGALTIKFYEKTMFFSHSLVGMNTIELDSLLLHVDDDVNLQGHFFDERHCKSGHAVIQLQLQQTNDTDDRPAIEEGFESAVLEVSAIKLSDLKHTDAMFSSNVSRPFVSFTYADAPVYTTAKDSKPFKGGILFEHLTFEKFDLTPAELKEYDLHVEVYDQVGMSSKTLIGSAIIGLDEVRLNQTTPLEADIMKNGKVAGCIIFFVVVDDSLTDLQLKQRRLQELSPRSKEGEWLKVAEQKKKAIEEFLGGILVIKNVTAKNLPNVEIGAVFGDKSDPFVEFEYCGVRLQTDYQQDAGSSAYFKDLYYTYDVKNSAVLTSELLRVSVFDHNSTTDAVLIGSQAINLGDHILEFDDDADASTINTNYLCKLRCELKSEKNEDAGHLLIECMMKPSEETLRELTTCVDVPNTFEKGILSIKKILGKDLRANTSNDETSLVHSPYLMFDYCENTGGGGDEKDMLKIETTGMQYTAMGSGGDPAWICSYKQRVTKACLRNEPMIVYVRENADGKKYQSNINIEDDRVIAVGCIDNMLLAGSQPGNDTEVHVDLYSPSDRSIDKVGIPTSTSEKRAGCLGHLTLFLEVTDTTGKEDLVKISPRTGSEDFEFDKGLLCLRYVVAKGLKYKGRPSVSFMVEDAPETEEVLPVLTNATGDLHWDISSRIPVNVDILQRRAIILTAREKNSFMGTTILGHGESALDFFASATRINKPVELSIQLFDEKGKSSGRIILGAEVRPLDKDANEAIEMSFDEDFVSAQVQFYKIQTHNLKNTELIGKADPYIKIIDNDGQDIGKTFTLFDKGGSVLFDYLDIKSSSEDGHLYSAEDIEQKTVTIEAWDDNTFPIPDKFIGKGVVRLKDLKGPWDREVELPMVPLVDGHGNATGRVHIHAKLVKPPPPKNTPLVFPDTFQSAVAYIKRICGYGIKNVNMTAILGNKADPYISLAYFPTSSSVSPIWTNETAPIMDSGDHALWDYLDMQFPIDKDGITDGTLLVTAIDKNVGSSDKFIGAGVVPIKRLAQSIVMEDGGGKVAEEGKTIEISVDLTLDSAKRDACQKKGGNSNGRIVLHIEVAREQPKEEELIAKHDFGFGTLHINKVRTFDLKNTEWMTLAGGMQDPYVKLKFADWQDQTHPKEDAGSDALWDFLGMESPVYLENFLESKLEISVWDENTTRKDALIGEGQISIKKAVCEPYLGQEVKLSCQLTDDRNCPSGKVDIYLSVAEAQMGGTLPDDFDLGILQVRKALLLGAQSTCARPTLSFVLGDDSEILERRDFDEGENPCWDMNWKVQIDSHIARGAVAMIVNVKTTSFTGNVSTFGTAKVEVTEAAIIHNLGKPIQISTIVTDTSEKKVGRLVLECCITRDIVKSLPVTDGLPPTFLTGTLILHNLKVRGDLFMNKKIFCRLEYSNWNECTSTSSSNGANVTSWNFGDEGIDDGLLAEVNKDSLNSARLRIVVLEEGSTLKAVKELASGSLTANYTAQMCSSLKERIRVRLDLQESKDNAHVTVGTAELLCTLSDVDMLPDNDDGLPESSLTFRSAILQVKKVVAYDLRGGDVVGKPDPFVKLSIANLTGEGIDWKAQTSFQEAAGRMACWDNIDDIMTPITKDACLLKRLKVAALDHNNITNDAIMGSGDVGLRGAGAIPNQDKILLVPLKDKSGKNAGKVEITVCLVPDVDMTSGIDRDGDGVDDGLEGNKMQGCLEISSIEWNLGRGSDSAKIYPVVRLGGWKGTGDIRKSEGNQLWQWGTTFTAEKVSSAHIAQQGLHLQFHKATAANPTSSDKLIGNMKVVASSCLSILGEWVDLKGNYVHDGEFKGKYSMTLRFTPLDKSKAVEQKVKIVEQEVHTAKVASVKTSGPSNMHKPQGLMEVATEQPQPQLQGPGRGDEAINDVLNTHVSKIDAKNAEMEVHLQKQMKNMLAAQTADLQKSMEELELKTLRLTQKKDDKKNQLEIFNVTNVALPSNVSDWKIAHVQAWLAFEVELPAYMDNFRVASIDGHMLIRYIDDEVLSGHLGMTYPMQRKKVLDAIELLKERQEVIERKAETLRKATLRKEKAEEESELLRIKKEEEDTLRKSEIKEGKKCHKKTRKHSRKPKGKINMSATAPVIGEKGTMYQASPLRKGLPSEQNQIDRVKLERAAKLALIERQKLAAKMERKSGTWKFEYSGAPTPVVDDLWGDMTWQTGEHPDEGTKVYQNAMASLDPLSNDDLQQQGIYRGKLPHAHTLPTRSSGDEVLAAVKGCFFRLSSRLLEVQKRELRGMEHVDDDLLSVEYSVTDEIEEIPNEHAMDIPSIDAPTPSKEEVPLPPSLAASIPANLSGVTIERAFWEQPPPITDWETDVEKDDYLKASATQTAAELWAAPPPITEWDNDESYSRGKDMVGQTFNENDKSHMGVTVPGLAPVVLAPALSDSPMSKRRIHRILHKHVKNRKHQNTCHNELNLDRMTLVYRELVHQTNNNAPFIGTNDKLTRLKLLGGLESKCHLKLSWSQFDSLWTQIDIVRTGDLDLVEFKNFFGDLSEFEKNEGTKKLNMHSESKGMRELAKCLAGMCDTMRHAGFTVEEMFCCFDRNNSGTIAPSEFCSLLRLIVGPSFDKKLIYEALLVMDTDHDKTISRHELFKFVYRTWKMQLDEIDYRKTWLDPAGNPHDAHISNEYNKERNLIREAVRKNFNRQLRDLLDTGDTQLSGPFAKLLPDSSKPLSSVGAYGSSDVKVGVEKSNSDASLLISTDLDSSMPLPSALRTGSPVGSPSRGSGTLQHRHYGEIMRFKIKQPGASSPYRDGKSLTLPKIKTISLEEASPEATESILKLSNPLS